ncbi:MAG: LytTR family DNA-binding domain-containing protein [Bacteroidota bacterium]
MKKVAVIDDEAAGRSLIKEYLGYHEDLVIVLEANNGVDAVTGINRFKTDLIFIDVQMPGLTGFEVLTKLEEIPQVIFSTAYDQYALKAFEVHAIDYLLKPYTKARFDQAISRISSSDRPNPVAPLADSLLMQPSYPERVLVEYDKKLITVTVSEIIHVEAYGDYSKLVTADKTLVSNHGIGALEERLDPSLFIRVHRSHIINLSQVASMTRYPKSYDVKMINGDVVRVSRGYLDKVKDLQL